MRGARASQNSKRAAQAFTRSLVMELGPYGTNVNAVAPGFTLTEMVKQMPQKILDGMIARTPMKRMGETIDIANAYLFLASD